MQTKQKTQVAVYLPSGLTEDVDLKGSTLPTFYSGRVSDDYYIRSSYHSDLLDITKGTSIGDGFALFVDFLWDNYSKSFNIRRLYSRIKDYERRYGESSKEVYKRWKSGQVFGTEDEKDWILTYLRMVPFLEGE